MLLVTTVWVVEIFTTDGINLSAKSAKESGIFCEFDFVEKTNVSINIKKYFLNFFISIFCKINDDKTNY